MFIVDQLTPLVAQWQPVINTQISSYIQTAQACGGSGLERHLQFDPRIIDAGYKLAIGARLQLHESVPLHCAQRPGKVRGCPSRSFRQFMERLRVRFENQFEQISILVRKHLRKRAERFEPHLRFTLRMERQLAHKEDRNASPGEPLLLIECSMLSILWICGLYEVTRGLRASKSPRWAVFAGLHNSLAALRMPLAKHEVWRNEDQAHHPTSVWCPESGQVGWRVYNPQRDSMESYFRTKLADEFLAIATKIEE